MKEKLVRITWAEHHPSDALRLLCSINLLHPPLSLDVFITVNRIIPLSHVYTWEANHIIEECQTLIQTIFKCKYDIAKVSLKSML